MDDHHTAASGAAMIIISILPRASVTERREFPQLPVRPLANPSSPNKGGTKDTGFHLGVCHQVSTTPRGHGNIPGRGQVEEA